MSTTDTLTAWGILRPADVVELAAAEGLELAAACAMLEQESSGGRNVWGSDGVSTGGLYAKGSEVTQADYQRWKPHRARLGSQGVGPTQLTYPPLQDQADAIGGCWSPRANLAIGFRHLASLVRRYGERGGFVAYNGGERAAQRPGSVPAAEAYGDRAVARLASWRLRLGTTPTGTRPLPTIRDEVDMATLDELRTIVREEVAATAPDAVWAHPIPDFYQSRDQPPDLPAFAALGWAHSSAAWARDQVVDVGRRLDDLAGRVAVGLSERVALLPPVEGSPPTVTVEEVRALIVAALDEIGPLWLTADPPPTS